MREDQGPVDTWSKHNAEGCRQIKEKITKLPVFANFLPEFSMFGYTKNDLVNIQNFWDWERSPLKFWNSPKVPVFFGQLPWAGWERITSLTIFLGSPRWLLYFDSQSFGLLDLWTFNFKTFWHCDLKIVLFWNLLVLIHLDLLIFGLLDLFSFVLLESKLDSCLLNIWTAGNASFEEWANAKQVWSPCEAEPASTIRGRPRAANPCLHKFDEFWHYSPSLKMCNGQILHLARGHTRQNKCGLKSQDGQLRSQYLGYNISKSSQMR